ncbi:MAG: NfeD family protein [Candidatus Cloacimonetes bacterium]|nr:NfeD family protein [Candidatus Cloacimonadota bacterium]
MELAPWTIWMILGIICVIVEILDPAFFFLSLGIGCIMTGLSSLFPFIGNTIAIQIGLFVIFSFISFLLMKKLGKKVLQSAGNETNVFALKNKTAFVVKDIPAEGKGYVKVGGEEWSAVSEDKTEILQNSKVLVVDIDGNKLIVRKILED